MAIERKYKATLEPSIEEVKEEVKEVSVFKEEIKEEIWPKKYECKVRCWVSGKRQMFSPGEIAEFGKDEFVPSHFKLVE